MTVSFSFVPYVFVPNLIVFFTHKSLVLTLKSSNLIIPSLYFKLHSELFIKLVSKTFYRLVVVVFLYLLSLNLVNFVTGSFRLYQMVLKVFPSRIFCLSFGNNLLIVNYVLIKTEKRDFKIKPEHSVTRPLSRYGTVGRVNGFDTQLFTDDEFRRFKYH